MAYFLSTDFNGIDALKKDGSVARCNACDQPIRKYPEPVDTRKKTSLDFSSSRDGFVMVSEKFKNLYESCHFQGCHFLELSSGGYILAPKRCVDLVFSPIVASKSERCDICGQFTKFLRATHEAKVNSQETDIEVNEFVRSSQETPMVVGCDFHLIVGDAVAQHLMKKRIRRVVLHKI